MEGDVNALERDGGESALKIDGLRFGFGLVGALADDVNEARFDIFEGERFH